MELLKRRAAQRVVLWPGQLAGKNDLHLPYRYRTCWQAHWSRCAAWLLCVPGDAVVSMLRVP
jgi:hypothetical protein